MRSNHAQLSDFKDSVIWQDMVQEVSVWLEQIRDGLENPDRVLTHRELDRLGGCAEACRNFGNILEVLCDLAEDSTSARDEVVDNLRGGKRNE